MSLYDKASLVFSGKAAAGKDGKAYNIKPVEKLKVDERITNGSFDTDSDWIKTAGVTISGGKARMSDTSDVYRRIEQQDVFTVGKTYRVSVNLVVNLGTVKIGTEASANSIGLGLGSGQHSFYFTADANDLYIAKDDAANGYDIEIDNVSVREVEQKANDFTFTRGSNLTATRELPSGLIEKGRENQLLYSNQFDTTWTAISASITGGQQGYDGSTNAWELKATGNGSSHLARLNQVSLDVSGVSTFSVYAKAGNVNWIRLNGLKTGTNINNYFDLSGNGAVGASPSNTVVESKIESIGSGWFRISLTSKGDYPITEVRIQVAEADGDEIPATNSYVFIQNSQLEQGLVPTPYINTTDSYSKKTAGVLENEPRYDYSGGDATLLLEPQRRNLVKHSEYLSDYNTSNATKTINALTSPEGVNNAATINVTSNSGSVYAQSGSVVESVEAETKYTFSFYVKRGTNTENYLAVRDQSAEAFISEDVAYTASTTEWKRISHTFTTPAGCTSIRLYPQRYSSGGQGTTHLFGIQLEKGSYATSYIPTYGSAATREGEAHQSLSSFRCELDNPLSKKYTFILDLRVDNLERPTASFDDIFVTRDSSGNNNPFRLEGYAATELDPDEFSLRVFAYSTKDSGAALSSPHANGIQLGQRNKIAIMFDETVGIKVFLNGNSTPLEQVLIGDAFSTNSEVTLESNSFYDVKFLEGGSNSRSKTLLYGVQAYDVALSDAECVSLTTIS